MRLYTEKDVSALLRRAAELQAQAEGGPASGLTLAELKGIAAETGIDPKFVEQAALSSGQVEKREGRYHFWGGPGKLVAERTAAGELPVEAWPDLIAAFQDTFGQPGETSEVGRGLEWRYGYMGQSLISASVTTRKGTTTLRVRHSLENEAGVIWGLGFTLPGIFPLIAALIGTVKGSFNGWVAFPAAFALVALIFFACRAGFRRVARKEEEKLDALVERFEALVARETQGAAPDRVGEPVAHAAPAGPRVALPDALDPEPEADRAGGRRRSRA